MKLILALIFPLIATLFFLDRVVLLFVWNVQAITFKKWLFNEAEMRKSAIRVLVGLVVVLIILVSGMQ